ncbi:cytochrome b/b6 domain-containing protein [Litorivivens sp.]|uniref:cytochrome b/b6 domain-containing protein n=1 Tax=Litorivivens sp. TaxID=2020868 RepID=UPI00356339C5
MVRYNRVAIAFHWLIAALIIINLGLGWWMGDALNDSASRNTAANAFQWHKSIGLSVLALSLLRLSWRLLHPAPALPPHTPPWERFAASATHGLFYALMLGLPLSGWLYVSTQWRGDAPMTVPTLWFGLFEVPHLLALNTQDDTARQAIAGTTLQAHEILSSVFILLLVLHVAAAFRHHLMLRDDILARMIPALSSADKSTLPSNGRAGATRALLVLAASVAFIAIAIERQPQNQTAPAIEQQLQRLQDSTTTASLALTSSWQLITEKSYIGFSGSHAGRPFTGRFGHWVSKLHLPLNNPDAGTVLVVVDTGSASDGVPLHNRTLPEPEWFDVSTHPFATFQSTAITARDNGDFDLHGVLTIKGQALILEPLTLRINNDSVRISGELTIDRANIPMGMESDPSGEWVSRDIKILVEAQWSRQHDGDQ